MMQTETPPTPHMYDGRRFRWLALSAALMTFVLIVAGAIVRVTGSGLGCPDWPLCYGRIIPPLRFDVWVEYSHRLAASVTSPLILLTAGIGWLRYRQERPILWPALVSVFLLVVQIVLGGITVLYELPPTIVAIHLGNALLILALQLAVAVALFRRSRFGPPSLQVSFADPLARFALIGLLVVFGLIVSGAYVTSSGSAFACSGWPLCSGSLWPDTGLGRIHMFHRLFAALSVPVVFLLAKRAWDRRRRRPGTFVASTLALTLILIQVLVGALNVLRSFPPVLNGLHIATASAVWGTLAISATFAVMEAGSQERKAVGEAAVRLQWTDFVALTKPVIVALLLVTTMAAMIVGAGGWPGTGLVVWTLIGGALASGGAGALNQLLDQELDGRMQRTRDRPLPSGRLVNVEVLAFGLALCVLSFFVLALFVNLLAALLALAGMIYYVVLYTMWLKPTTAHNIVIGGGAGAIPPLVGWAAATGGLDIAAFFLFAFIFFWTPPHFWALALVRRLDYARAGVPMLPVVQGDAQTRRLILLYTLQVVALTFLMPLVDLGGGMFLIAAGALGAGLLLAAWRLWRRGGNRAAWGMYRYSSLYLALVFAAMVLDVLIA